MSTNRKADLDRLTEQIGVRVSPLVKEAYDRACLKERRPASQLGKLIIEDWLRAHGELK